jgi:nitroreductase
MDNMIFKRTSVRKYTDKSVTKDQIEMLMKAGMAAPSAKNVQPWEFVVIQEKENLLKITEFHPYSFMLKQAPLAIVVCGNTTKIALEGVEDLWVQDCAAATQNILLEATELGLGSVWLGVYPKKEIVSGLAELLILPDYIVPFSLISIGYPEGEVTPKDKFNPDRIHWEKWSGK